MNRKRDRNTALGSGNSVRHASVLLIAAVFAVGATAQTFVYPAKGQSADQQKKDEGACHTWAVRRTRRLSVLGERRAKVLH